MGTFSKFAASNTDSSSSLSKWQVALIVSVPVAFGLGYLYYRSSKSKSVIVKNGPKKAKESNKTPKIEENIQNHKKPLMTDLPEEKPKTPIQQAEDLKNQGNVHFKSSRYEEAVQCYTEAIKLCPEYEKHTMATFYQNRAAANERMDNTEGVIRDCTEALNLNKRYLKAIVRRAKASEKAGKFDSALEDLATAGMIESFQNQETISEMDRIAHLSGRQEGKKYLDKQKPKLPSKFFIRTYLSTFTTGSAIDKVQFNTDETTTKLLQMFNDAKSCLVNGECDKVEDKCTELINESKKVNNSLMTAEGLLLRGTYYTLSNQTAKAFKDLTEVIEDPQVDPRVRSNALIKRATASQHTGDTKQCEEDFRKAEEIDENNPDIYHHLGQVNLIMDRLEESVNNFRKACALDPDFPISAVQHCFVEYKLASMQNDSENTKYFFSEFKNLIDRFPDSVECITLYAQVLVEKQSYAEAERLYNIALQKEPHHAALYVHKALLILQWKADIEEAKKLIKKAIIMDKDCEFAYETMATIEMQLGNFKAAAEYFDMAIPRYTSNEELFHLFSVRNTCAAQSKATERLGLYAGTHADLSFVK